MSSPRPSRLGILLLAAVSLCGHASAFQQATLRFDPEAPLSPLEQLPGELGAYEAILDQADATRRISLIHLFLGEYPTSEFRHLVLRARWEVRIEQGNPVAIIDAAEEAMEAEEHFRLIKLGFISDPSRIRGLPEFRHAFALQKAAYYQSVVEAHRDLGDFAEMVEQGERALTAAAEAWALYQSLAEEGTREYQAALEQNREMQAFILVNLVEAYETAKDVPRSIEFRERILKLNPNDVQTLMTTSRMMAEQPLPEGEDRTAYMQRARGYAESALEQLEVYSSGPLAADLDAERSAILLGDVQHTLGLIHFRLEAWGSAAEAFRAAIDAVPDDPILYLMLGLASRQQGDVDGFLSAYARAVHLKIAQPQVRADLERIYRAVNGSLQGLGEFIDNEAAQIEIPGRGAGSQRTAYIETLIDGIELLPTVFPPNRFCYQYYEFLASQDLRWARDALEIGVGSGVNSMIVLDRGVGRLLGTDINENAVKAFRLNAFRFGRSNRVEGRHVPLDEPEAFSVIRDDERFDLIISNPPWEATREPRRISEYAFLDSGWVLLRSMLAGFSDHLKENGKVWLLYGDPRIIPSRIPPAVEIVMEEAPAHGLRPTILYSNSRCSIVEIVVNR